LAGFEAFGKDTLWHTLCHFLENVPFTSFLNGRGLAMHLRSNLTVGLVVFMVTGGASLLVFSEERSQPPAPVNRPAKDAIAEAQRPPVKGEQTRPEQRLNQHDRSNIFDPKNAPPSSPALNQQPEQGKILGFDFARDPLDARKPMQLPTELMKLDVEMKPKVMALQRKLLESRYDLKPRLDAEAKMSRGKPLCVGPTARLAKGLTWDTLAQMSPQEIREKNVFPYPSLPHPKHTPGGFVFPKMVVDAFPRLERVDVDFDLPDEFLPEFPPAMFLQNHPELGDVSRGQVVTINNFYDLFVELLTPVQMDGLRLMLTPLPQEEFNPTDDRKTKEASLGVTCMDCHVNGHTAGAIELNPDMRPQQRRIRLDTPTIRGAYNAQLFGSKRSIRSLRDFAQFEHRTAYFNSDHIHAAKKGIIVFTPQQAAHMERFQAMLDFPPAPKLTVLGKLDRSKATPSELRGQELFFGKAQCSVCHPAPFYIDNFMHDLHTGRFLNEPPDGPVKTFSLRGIKDSPPYLHDGRCLTLEDTVEFFNLILELRLNEAEKHDLVAFMRCL
jgi:cytochrome c peroxidase